MFLGLTQRVEKVQNYSEKRDCLDQRWHELLSKFGHVGVPIPNSPGNVIDFISSLGVKGLIFTGGNDIFGLPGGVDFAPERDKTERLLLSYAASLNMPILTVCRGFQLMNIEFGGSLTLAKGHIGESHEIQFIDGLIEKKKTYFVNSYHKFVIKQDNLGLDLNPIALAGDNTIEAVSHKYLPWFGVMWHPERNNIAIDKLIFNRLFSF